MAGEIWVDRYGRQLWIQIFDFPRSSYPQHWVGCGRPGGGEMAKLAGFFFSRFIVIWKWACQTSPLKSGGCTADGERERKSCQPGIEMRPLGHLPTYIRHTHVCLRSLFTHTLTLGNHINISLNSKKPLFPFLAIDILQSKTCNEEVADPSTFFFFL